MQKKLDKVYDNARQIPFDRHSKLVFMSDCHRGDGSGADNFYQNKNIYTVALERYFQQGFTYVELGDGDEMWANKDFSYITKANGSIFEILTRFYQKGRIYFIYGNHDMVKREKTWVRKNLKEYDWDCDNKVEPLFPGVMIHEGLKLVNQDNPYQDIFLVHGHQVDIINSTLWKASRFLVRHFWRPLEILGVKDPTSPVNNHNRKIIVENALADWSLEHQEIIIAGHTHRVVFPEAGEPPYFNDGCCVYPHYITAIEIEQNNISLVKWRIKTRDDGSLYIDKDVVKGPVPLETYYQNMPDK